ncbi:MAG: class I SAM-dependent methyltransferase [Ignavibacteriaceae bacterium]
MGSNRNAKPYSLIAPYYSLIMSHVDYSYWVKYILKVVKEFLPPDPSLLELAAGNCSFAGKLSKKFDKIVVSDLSVEMLKEDKHNLSKLCCDMTTLPFRSSFDMVFSLFDSVNYLLRLQSLKKLLNEVSQVLKENGIFVFDVSLEGNSYKFLKETSYNIQNKDVKIFHTSGYNPAKRIHTNKFELIKNGRSIGKEIHRQKIYPFESYFSVIENSDLYVARCYEAFTRIKGSESSQRILFILKRKYYAQF